MLRDAVGRILRHAHDGDAMLLGGFEIDVVETGAAHRYCKDIVIGERTHAVGTQVVVHERTDRVMPFGQTRRMFVQMAFDIGHLVTVSAAHLIEELDVVGLGSVHGDFHSV